MPERGNLPERVDVDELARRGGRADAPPETGEGPNGIDFGSLLVNANPAVGLGALLATPRFYDDNSIAFESERYNTGSTSDRVARVEAYNEINDEIARRIQYRLSNPEDQRFGLSLDFRRGQLVFDPMPTPAYLADLDVNDPVRRWHADVARLLREHPDELGDLADRVTPEALTTRAEQMRRDRHEAYMAYMGDGPWAEQMIRSIRVMPGAMLGAVSSGSPEQVAQYGALTASRGLSLLERLFVGGVAAGVGQTAVEPVIIAQARESGYDYTWWQVFQDYATTMAFGAVGEGVLGAGEHTPLNPIASNLESTAASTPPGSDISGLQSPEAASFRARVNGTFNEPILSAVERDAATLGTAHEGTPEQLVQEMNDADNFMRDASYTYPLDRTEVPRATSDAERAGVSRLADDATPPPHRTVEMFEWRGEPRRRVFERLAVRDINDVQFAPDVFQYKATTGPNGSTGRLEGVARFDPQSSGKVIIWEAQNGERFVADGHQRIAFEQRLIREGADAGVTQDAYIYRQADGWTAREVRDIAAQKNLRESPGDPIDTARLLRDAPELLDDSVPRTDRGMRMARSLARLSDEAFQLVSSGRLDPRHGAIIADVTGDRTDMQMPLAQTFLENPPRTLGEATFIARTAMDGQILAVESAQLSFFNEPGHISTLQNRWDILNKAIAVVRSDKRLFAAATRNAETLTEAGNILARDENARREAMAAIIQDKVQSLATRPGPVADLLRDVTENAAINKRSARDAGEELARRLMELVERHGWQGLVEAPRAVDPPPEKIQAPWDRVESDLETAELADADTLDTQALDQALAETALERAIIGDVPAAELADDAVGLTTEADMEALGRAANTLGLDPDQADLELAARILARARANDDLVAASQRRNEPAAVDPERPTTHRTATKKGPVKSPFNPFDFDERDKLETALQDATLPELRKMVREFGIEHGFGASSAAELRTAIVTDWLHATGGGTGDNFAMRPLTVEQAFELYRSSQKKPQHKPSLADRIIELSFERIPRSRFEIGADERFRNPTEITEQLQKEGFWKGRPLKEAREMLFSRRSIIAKQAGFQWPEFERAPDRVPPTMRLKNSGASAYTSTWEGMALAIQLQARAQRDELAHAMLTGRPLAEGAAPLNPRFRGDYLNPRFRMGSRVSGLANDVTLEDVAARLGISVSEAHRSVRRHAQRLREAYNENVLDPQIPSFPRSIARTLDVRDLIEMRMDGMTDVEIAAMAEEMHLQQYGKEIEVKPDVIAVQVSKARQALRKVANDPVLWSRTKEILNWTNDEELRAFMERGGQPKANRQFHVVLDAVRKGYGDNFERMRSIVDSWRETQNKPPIGERSLRTEISKARAQMGTTRPQKRLTPEQLEQIRALRHQGIGGSDIGAALELPPATVYQAVKRMARDGEQFPPYAISPSERTRAQNAARRKAREEAEKNKNKPEFALTPEGTQQRSTVEELRSHAATDPLLAGMYRYGEKTGRLRVVQHAYELPASAFEGYSLNAVRTSAQRRALIKQHTISLETEANSFYSWKDSAGRVMAIQLDHPTANMAEIHFGQLMGNGHGVVHIRNNDRALSGALQTIQLSIAALEEDIAKHGRPVYFFRAADNGMPADIMDILGRQRSHPSHLASLYDRMIPDPGKKPLVQPPDGYVIDRFGDTYIVVSREAIEASPDKTPQSAFSAELDKTFQELEAADRDGRRVPSDAEQQKALYAETWRRPPIDRFAKEFATSSDGLTIAGYHAQGVSYIVADHVAPQDLRGYVFHEMGAHVGLREALGEDGYARLIYEVQRLREEGDLSIADGYVQAQGVRTSGKHLWDETLAYAIQFTAYDQMSTGLVHLIRRIATSIRMWLIKHGAPVGNLTFDDMRYMALGAANSVARKPLRDIDAPFLVRRNRPEQDFVDEEDARADTYTRLRDCT